MKGVILSGMGTAPFLPLERGQCILTEFMLVKAADQSDYAQIKRGMMGSWYDVPDCVGQPVNQTWSVSYKAQRAYILYDAEYYNFNATLRIYF